MKHEYELPTAVVVVTSKPLAEEVLSVALARNASTRIVRMSYWSSVSVWDKSTLHWSSVSCGTLPAFLFIFHFPPFYFFSSHRACGLWIIIFHEPSLSNTRGSRAQVVVVV